MLAKITCMHINEQKIQNKSMQIRVRKTGLLNAVCIMLQKMLKILAICNNTNLSATNHGLANSFKQFRPDTDTCCRSTTCIARSSSEVTRIFYTSLSWILSEKNQSWTNQRIVVANRWVNPCQSTVKENYDSDILDHSG